MNNFILGVFGFLKSFMHFFKIVSSFVIMVLILYWIQNLIHAEWAWLGFCKSWLDWLLEAANSIYSVSFEIFGSVFEFKYISALILIVLMGFAAHWIIFGLNILEGLYKGGHFICKKTCEAVFNKQLQSEQAAQEKKLNKYKVLINTSVKTGRGQVGASINLDEQNELMNKFITEKTGVVGQVQGENFVYSFNNFEKIDTVLDVLFRVVNSNAPLNYVVCIQVLSGNQLKDLEQLQKLEKLKIKNKICFTADTAYRYRFNSFHKYEIVDYGVYNDFEVYEFQEIL